VRHALAFAGEDITAIQMHCGCVVSGSSTGTLRAHDARSGAQIFSAKLPRPCPISAIVVVPCLGDAEDTKANSAAGGGACVLAASFNRVHAYSLAQGTPLGQFEAHADLVCALSWSASTGTRGSGGQEGTLYTASHDTTIKAWPVRAAQPPWQAGVLPLLELDAPDASTPLCCVVR
jgi:WD40 repeat protein